MKFLLLLAVLVGASFAAPSLPTTFTANAKFEIISSTAPKTTGKAIVAEDNDIPAILRCFTPDGSTNGQCSLLDYSSKTLYSYTMDASGQKLNCTKGPLPSNESTYRNEWVWLPESKDEGSTTNSFCGKSGETYELKFEGKIDLKLIMGSNNQPGVTDYKLSNSTGSVEIIMCFTSFSTSVDPKEFTPPSNCKSGLIKKEDNIFPFHRIF